MTVTGIRRLKDLVLADNRIDRGEVDQLISKAKDWLQATPAEKAELKNILFEHVDKFDGDAKQRLADFLGVSAPQPGHNLYIVVQGDTLSRIARNKNVSLDDLIAANPQIANPDVIHIGDEIKIPGQQPPVTPPPDPVPDDPINTGAGAVDDITRIADAFKAELGQRRAELDTPAKVFALFSEYGGRLKALRNDNPNLDPKVVDKAVEDLLDAGRQTPARGYDKLDSDHDTMSDLREAAQGTDPHTFDRRVMEAEHKVWTSTYWPMAGSGSPDGNPQSHLWAKDGPLDKLDRLLTARGMADRAKALEFERKPALNWLIGERSNKGHYIPEGMIVESDAERSTGVDFDGDGKITDNVRVDFLDKREGFAPVYSRSALKPKLKEGDRLIDLTRKEVRGADGSIEKFEFFKPDGSKVTPAEAGRVFYTHSGGSGDADGSMSVGWWGSCDKVALAGILFKEPERDVTIDGVTFTTNDIKGLLTVIADSQAVGHDFVGSRYDDRPDLVRLRNGQTIEGKIETDVEFRHRDTLRVEGDYMTIDDVDKPITIRTTDGQTKTFQPSEIRNIAREDKRDINPALFHETMVKWLGEDKRPAAMDRDSGDHVWNYNFWKADLKEGTKLEGTDRPTEHGHNGPAGDGEIMKYKMDVYFGESDYPKNYEYWVEYDADGKAINGGWMSENPDFLWRPGGFANWSGHNARNPFVDPKLVKEIYMKSIGSDGGDD